MRITKIVLDKKKVEITSESEDAKGTHDIVNWNSEIEPPKSFQDSFQSLRNFVCDLLKFKEDQADKITIGTLNIGYKDDKMKIIISAKLNLEDGTAPFCFNTPLRYINHQTVALNITAQAAEIIDEIIVEAKNFMKQKYQIGLFNKEAA